MPSISAPPLRPASFLVAMLRSQLTHYQKETRKLKTNCAKLQTKLNEASSEDKGQWQTWVTEAEDIIKRTDQQELSTELLIERVSCTHSTEKSPDVYKKLLSEIVASNKSMDYHLEAIQLSNKRYSGHVS